MSAILAILGLLGIGLLVIAVVGLFISLWSWNWRRLMNAFWDMQAKR